MWSEGRTFIFRSAIFVGLASVVTTIIYFTPIPHQGYISSQCERPCHELEMPMICRLKLTLEPYETLSRSCGACPRDSSDCLRRHCVQGDGHRRGLLTVNRQLPGPTIQVCENDILVVDVINHLPGQEVTMHWRGQPQKETPFMDGVAMVTQCPIPSATTFQYKFRASRAGTHLWQAHQAGRESNHLFGALIVRQAESRISEREHYDVDDRDHVVVVSAFRGGHGGGTGALLINGRTHIQRDGNEYHPTSLSVTQGKRYRFRLANTGIGCPINVSVDNHQVLVIALDGHLIVPREVAGVELGAGERVDFILNANQPNASYRLHATTSDGCVHPPLRGVAFIRYAGAEHTEPTPNAVGTNLVGGSVVHLSSAVSACAKQREDVCITQLQATKSMEDELRRPKMDFTLFLAFGYTTVDPDDTRYPWSVDDRVPYINNLTFTSPTSSLLTQPNDVTYDLCHRERRPSRCDTAALCACVHVIDIPLDASVELVLLDEGGVYDSGHVIHLHGYSFHVVGATELAEQLTFSEAMDLDERGELLSRNLDNPVIKDTLTLPRLGVAALRFKAENPGYWLLEAERGGARMSGMSVLLHVGVEGDTPPPPDDFPRCGSWVGPDFFLI